MIVIFDYILVVQFEMKASDDFDRLLLIEQALEEVFLRNRDKGDVDGHDAGSGEMNIFIRTDDPAQAFTSIRPTLERLGVLAGAKVAYRERTGEIYTCLHPVGLLHFAVK